MLTLTIWRAAILLELLIVFRGFRGRLFSKYPFFYTYIVAALVSDVTFYVVYMLNRAAYSKWYWISTTVVVILGYGIILEVFRNVLAAYPGAEKFARVTGFAILAAIFCFVMSYSLLMPEIAKTGPVSDLRQDIWIVQAMFQRDFWTVQAIFL